MLKSSFRFLDFFSCLRASFLLLSKYFSFLLPPHTLSRSCSSQAHGLDWNRIRKNTRAPPPSKLLHLQSRVILKELGSHKEAFVASGSRRSSVGEEAPCCRWMMHCCYCCYFRCRGRDHRWMERQGGWAPPSPSRRTFSISAFESQTARPGTSLTTSSTPS